MGKGSRIGQGGQAPLQEQAWTEQPREDPPPGTFIAYLDTIDKRHTAKTKDEIIAAKEEEIRNLKAVLDALKVELKAARRLETEDYINITKDQLLTFLDLCLQMQEIKFEASFDFAIK
ncbi:hypothetical protein [Sphingobacterium sp. JB170]|uniref:hypothetical protein n=1 Tax=Sphingobacterium sp. JB170 TaxID=1434842 RepID=UPI00097E7A40|nr:hypothetical protein [Sphingobacterium sp. JB170]SJN21030.1 hypothetical protein FM107_02615 [Sphingobacterium sp. JB170]